MAGKMLDERTEFTHVKNLDLSYIFDVEGVHHGGGG